MRLGLDIGSTTIKCVVTDDAHNIVYTQYKRHLANILEAATDMLGGVAPYVGDEPLYVSVSGSAGLGLAEGLGIPFIQEVYATSLAVKALAPDTDVVIELGGEDAKILFMTGGTEVRMNGSCAGGTGAFIDQMATLLGMDASQLNELAKDYDEIYAVASRCGVFAKSDIQPLLNQGAQKKDIAASILYAVVSQTIAGLTQGREIHGNVLYLGGPLTFLSELQKAFNDTLKCDGVCPEHSLYYVALGTAMSPTCGSYTYRKLMSLLSSYKPVAHYGETQPLFADKAEYAAFLERHSRAAVQRGDLLSYDGDVYVGIDAGSTTVKLCATDADGRLLHTAYALSDGNPARMVKEYLLDLYRNKPDVRIKAAAVTGYGEEIVQGALCVDYGVVETVAHLYAAKAFCPDVDFLIDIGGQDIKCFKIDDGNIDSIFLNEACSSGCGSFLQTFAMSLGYDLPTFAAMGLFASHPVDLGSRCTVFMNSSVKQAQKDGALASDISAGLCRSVVRNALHKVIRVPAGQTPGKRIVVQGGTFYNDAVLRAFELELGQQVIRPDISGLMGAYGAALYAEAQHKHGEQRSTILTAEALRTLKHEVRASTCKLCGNNCSLTINTFSSESDQSDSGKPRRYIGGNRCERPLGRNASGEIKSIYEYKLELLDEYKPIPGVRGRIGIPMGLNMYELYPFWYTFFTKLGFEVVRSPYGSRALYTAGQHTIPSDTVCYPAKLMHGHMQYLIDNGIEHIWYPCMTYNFDEQLGDNNYNCPVVAYYPEVLSANIPNTDFITFICDYIGPHRPKDFIKKITQILSVYFNDISLKQVEAATQAAFDAHAEYMSRVRKKAEEFILYARHLGKPIIVLAGRPYHIDPEISHSIDKLICRRGGVVISEDCVSHLAEKPDTSVLNQWTYHSRLYAAADYVGTQPDMQVIQLVSFGCGVDAITSDEVRDICRRHNKLYTLIKIDEITGLGAVNIRVRSLFAAIGAKEA